MIPKHDPSSEAAILDYLDDEYRHMPKDVSFVDDDETKIEIAVHCLSGWETVIILDLREIVRKRQPLTGIRKMFRKIIRGKR